MQDPLASLDYVSAVEGIGAEHAAYISTAVHDLSFLLSSTQYFLYQNSSMQIHPQLTIKAITLLSIRSASSQRATRPIVSSICCY